jgi:ribosome-binding factor A
VAIKKNAPTEWSAQMKHRLLRVNEVLKRELSGIITREMKFEKGLVTINQVNVTADLKSAHVFVSVLGTAGADVITQLEAHRAALQSALAKHVVLKYTPHLVFHLDDSIERGTRVIEIMQAIDSARENKA